MKQRENFWKSAAMPLAIGAANLALISLVLATVVPCSFNADDTLCRSEQKSGEGESISSANDLAAAEGFYATTFSLDENPLSESGKWVTGKTAGRDWNDPQAGSGNAHALVRSGVSGSRYDDSIAHLSKSFQTFSANQYAEGTVYLAKGYKAAFHEVELLLRFSIDAHDAHGYEVLWSLRGSLAVVRWNGPLGNYTPLYDPGAGSAPVPRNGDVMRVEISDNILTVKLNGKTVARVDVSSAGGPVWSSGQPGIGFWPIGDTVPRNYGWDSFRAGNL